MSRCVAAAVRRGVVFGTLLLVLVMGVTRTAMAQYPATPQVTKDGTAVVLQDFASLPLSSVTTGSYPPPIDFREQLGRVNFLRSEPANVPQSSLRFFVVDMNADLYILDKSTRAFTSYINFARIFPKFDSPSGFAAGLLTVAFDPEYASNGRFYTVHTEDPARSGSALPTNVNFPGLDLSGGYTTTPTVVPPAGTVVRESVLVEWRDTNVSDSTFAGTAREVLRIGFNSNGHPMGDLLFNPLAFPGHSDYRNLYVVAGDGHAGETAGTMHATPQRLDALQGKILRITPDINANPLDPLGANGRYRIPATGPDPNPFVSVSGARGEIYAYGFRNPHRLNWDPATDTLIVTDIGLIAWEEVNIVTKGANYGYAERDGVEQLFIGGTNHRKTGSQTSPPTPFPSPDTLTVTGLPAPVTPVYPVAAYSHRDGDAISSGFVYRGALVPQLVGKYVFGDITNGRLFYADLAEMIASHDGTRTTVAAIHELQVIHDAPDDTPDQGAVNRRLYDIVAEAFVRKGGIPIAPNVLPGAAVNVGPGMLDPYGIPYGGGRADIRIAVGGDNEMYVLSKSDGMIRVLAAPGGPPNAAIPVISPAGGAYPSPLTVTITDTTPGATIYYTTDGTTPTVTPSQSYGGAFSLSASATVHAIAVASGYSNSAMASAIYTVSPPGTFPPVVSGVNPTSGVQGQTLNVVIAGNYFQSPAACSFGSGISVNSCTFNSAMQLTANITVAAAATMGARTVTVTNPDTQVASLNNGFTVTAAALPAARAAYSLNAGTGLTAADLSGNSNNGTLQNGASWTTSGKYGNALSFDGIDDFVSAPDSPSLDVGSTGTIAAWVRLNALNRWQSIIAKGNANSSPIHNYSIEVTDANRFMCILGSGGAARTLTSTTAVTTGTFYHVACVWNGTQLRLYINGTLNTSVAQNLTPAANTSPLYIGQYGGNVDRLSGVIDEVRIHAVALSDSEIQTAMNMGVEAPVADTTPPTVSLNQPSNGATVSGTITVSASASDNVGVVGVQFFMDGLALGSEDTSSPFELQWNTTTASPGPHQLSARARDGAGNQTPSAVIAVFVDISDTTLPSAAITAPANGATVSGTVAVNASASDNVAVVGVQLLLDGAALGAEDTSAPWSTSWVSTGTSNGTHTLAARARDAAGNVTTSAGVTVMVSNDSTPPTAAMTAPANGATVSGTVAVNASASDNVAVVGVQFLLDGAALGAEDTSAPWSTSWATLGTSNGTHALTARARDAAGNTSTSPVVAVTVSNDTTPPTAAVTSPAAGATVSGTVAVTASASDNTGVVGVQFLLDGVALGAEDTSTPWSTSWATAATSNGTHALTARARDAAGNTSTSPIVTVTVSNAAPPAPTGLVAAYGFEEGSGTTTTDRSGRGHTGTLSGATWTTAGRFGRALSFDGINDLVTMADTAALDLTTGMTLEAWVRPTTLGTWRTVVLKERPGSLAYALYANEDGSRPSGYIRVTNDVGVRGPAALPVNTWSHVAVTYNATTLALYVNGAQVASRAQSGAIRTSSSPLRIGGNTVWGEYFAGLIDEVRIYSRALSGSEIQSDMNTAVGP